MFRLIIFAICMLISSLTYAEDSEGIIINYDTIIIEMETDLFSNINTEPNLLLHKDTNYTSEPRNLTKSETKNFIVNNLRTHAEVYLPYEYRDDVISAGVISFRAFEALTGRVNASVDYGDFNFKTRASIFDTSELEILHSVPFGGQMAVYGDTDQTVGVLYKFSIKW